MKCQLCRKNEATWSMQYIAEDKPTFAVPGWHYRGFKVTKVCDECKEQKEQEYYNLLNEPKQTTMFDDGSDLPLFSGTPPKKV